MNILITGGASGIGSAIVNQFKKNHRVTVLDKNEVVDNDVDYYQIDLTSYDELKAFQESNTNQYDALVNVAGMREIVAPDDLTLELWETIFKINVTAPFLLSQFLIKNALETTQKLSIINIASISGILAEPDRAAYVSSKHALIGLTKQFAYQYGKKGIRVNAIAPGIIETEMTSAYFSDPAMVSLIESDTPLGTWGQSHHLLSLIDVCLFNDYLTGSVLICDGGWSCGKSL